MSAVTEEETLQRPRPGRRVIDRKRSVEVEKWIDGYGVQHELILDVSIAGGIDVDTSQHNQGRFTALDPEVVDRYTANLLDGQTLPPIVTYRARDGRLVTIDGNHRVAAHEAASKEDGQFGAIAAYVVRDASPSTIATMTVEANVRHGKPIDNQERVAAAVWHVSSNGLTVAEACGRLGITNHASVQRAVRLEKAALRAHSAGIVATKWDRLTPYARERLGSVHTDVGMAAAVDLVFAAGLKNTEVGLLVTDMNATHSGPAQVKLVKELAGTLYAERIESLAGGALVTSGNSKKAQTPRQKLGAGLGFLTALGEDLSGLARQFRPQEREEWVERVDAAVASLTSLREALAAREQ